MGTFGVVENWDEQEFYGIDKLIAIGRKLSSIGLRHAAAVAATQVTMASVRS